MITLDSERMTVELARQIHAHMASGRRRTRLAPQLSYGRHFGPVPGKVRRAAVLVALCRSEQGWLFPLTRRPAWLDHPHQISFPGGRAEPGESAEDTALREFEEELGPASGTPRIVGRLSQLYVYVSNNCLTPVVAVLDHVPAFRPDPQEVAEVIEGRADVLLQDRVERMNVSRTIRSRTGKPATAFEFAAPGWQLGGAHVWGATALILSELATILACLEKAHGGR